jgi:hypothetical protein
VSMAGDIQVGCLKMPVSNLQFYIFEKREKGTNALAYFGPQSLTKIKYFVALTAELI